jgi:hypothetical protein
VQGYAVAVLKIVPISETVTCESVQLDWHQYAVPSNVVEYKKVNKRLSVLMYVSSTVVSRGTLDETEQLCTNALQFRWFHRRRYCATSIEAQRTDGQD